MKPRAILAGVCSLTAAAVFRALMRSSDPAVLWMPIVILVLAAAAGLVRWLGAQLFARAAWWSNFVIGILLCCIGNRNERQYGLAFMAACAAALVLADPRRLMSARADAGYRPARFATTLQIMMVIALADAMTLGLFAGAWMTDREEGKAIVAGALTVVLLIGFVGLYRLALWGVAATVTVGVALFVAVVLGVFDSAEKLVAALTVLSLVQIAVPVPMVVSLLRGKEASSPVRLPAWTPTAFILSVALLAGSAAIARF